MTSGNFSDKTWSGTPMWQIAEELEEQRRKRDEEDRRKASTPVAVLNVKAEGEHFLCELTLLIPANAAKLPPESRPDPSSGGFREVKVRGPRRSLRAEAVKDGFELRAGFHEKGEAEVARRCRHLRSKTWAATELPAEGVRIDEDEDKEQRLRLAQRPRGTGWSRQKDAEFFVHTHAPMAYDPKKMQYFTAEATTGRHVPCDAPHDPVEYLINVSAGASLVGKGDADLALAERPRTLLLKELVLTGRAMKKPLFFLDQPASCFVLFESVRGTAAAEYCAKNVHTKLLAKLSSTLQYWSDTMTQGLIRSIIEELDAELLQQPAACYDGAALAVALVLGDRMTLATLGGVRGLLLSPGGGVRMLGDRHFVEEEGPERQRLDACGGEVVCREQEDGSSKLSVRRPLRPRRTAVAQDQAAEIQRVLEAAPDSFAALGLGAEDSVDAKSAKVHYRKLALKVHPDKAPGDLKEHAKEAFAKVEAALERIEAMYDADAKATIELHRLLELAGEVDSAVMPRSWARSLLGLEEGAQLEEAEQKAEECKKTLQKLGVFADGRLAQPDAARAAAMLDEALEALQAPAPKEGIGLEAVMVSRALGLRDLKRPKAIVTSEPQIEVFPIDTPGSYHLALLSRATRALSDEEVVSRLRGFPRQPKTASLVIAQTASEAMSSRQAPPAACLASAVVAGFEVQEDKAEEPPTKKARAEQAVDKVRCLHILLKHKDLRMAKDPESQVRLKGKPLVSRTQAQAERELLAMQRSLLENPNIFHVLARKHSECDTAMQPGQSAGDLGWVSRGSCGIPQFEAALFGLKAYEVSDIISTPRGLHIVQRIA
uniref:peptidylprolyl isomerase n=1 Tax=Zooxanthella nutricula TaxID=1333877 RepID=A0A7S2Q391_9DINO